MSNLSLSIALPLGGTRKLASDQRGRVSMARLIGFLYLLPLGFVDLRAIAQETAAQSPLGQAMKSAALIAGQEKEANPGTAFKECDKGCPVMIVIPAGKFMLGSAENESERRSNEGPQHEVTIAKPFAVSKFEVTFEEWDACAAAAACAQAADGWGRERMPVINVSWLSGCEDDRALIPPFSGVLDARPSRIAPECAAPLMVINVFQNSGV